MWGVKEGYARPLNSRQDQRAHTAVGRGPELSSIGQTHITVGSIYQITTTSPEGRRNDLEPLLRIAEVNAQSAILNLAAHSFENVLRVTDHYLPN
jgi:hypothetical protein